MSSYFPLGNASFTASVEHGITAITSSRPLTTIAFVSTASYAVSVENPPAAGTNGINKTFDICSAFPSPTGERGDTGATGPAGTNITSCPAGTKPCTSLNASLTAFNLGRPAGSQFSIVCIQSSGYVYDTIVCPPTLPTSAVQSGGYWLYPIIP